MRLRSVVATLGISGLVVAALVRCNLPDLPPGPQAIPTRIGFMRGAFLRLPAAPLDHAALIASLKGLNFTTVAIESVADPTGQYVADRVALAIELQTALDADVFIGTYLGTGIDPMNFTSCYPGGLPFSPTQTPQPTEFDKLLACNKDASDKVAAALRSANASNRVGCYITLQPPVYDGTLNGDAISAQLTNLFRYGAGQCVTDGRFVGASALIDTDTQDPAKSGVFFRHAIADSGVNFLMLDDGVGQSNVTPGHAAAYYQQFRNAIEDREPSILVWANVEAYACADGACLSPQPATPDRFLTQLCAARTRVDGIMSTEYIGDLAGASFVDGGDAGDASDDFDAAAQLRNAYLGWVDAGKLPCP